jgi:hypothetical protein|tara:strand:+ start:3599 stop:4066 length:468 start_codon:yes stop_codon:yes gene_type:complete
MANIDNECKDLEVKDFYDQSATHLEDIMSHQKEMQEKTYGIKFDEMSIREVMDFWHVNTHAVIDELHEMTDALGGIKDGSGNAVWKYWKADFKKYETMKVSDLSEDDRKELFMEWIDVLHFFINYAASIGLDAKTAYNYYFAKAEENKNRQKRGY